MEEAEGIIAASSMNGNALGSLFARGAEEKKEDEGGGLMDMFSNLLGGDNLLQAYQISVYVLWFSSVPRM